MVPVVSLHRTDSRKLVTISLSSSIDKITVPPSRKVNLSTCSECYTVDECTKGIVLLMLHDACMYREPVTRELHMQKLSII